MAPSRRRSLLLTGGVALLAGAVVVTAGAQGPGARRAPFLHQDLEPPGPTTADPRPNLLVGPAPREAQNPTAVAAGSHILPEPSTARTRVPGEHLFGSQELGVDRLTDWRPDRQTEQDGTLRYTEVFNPSIVPFKRMTVLDSVGEDYLLHVGSLARADLPVGGEPESDEDLFWGSLVLLLRPGEDVAIPSVSPAMRILSYEVSPATRVVFSKDGADNYYVRSDESGAAGEHRLVFLTAARRSHFSPKVPRSFELGDLRRVVPSHLVRPLPREVNRVAQRILRHIGVSRAMRVDRALDELVRYFRAFEAMPPPPSTGDVYWDLCMAQAGVCRHRSFAFMITANAAGIPTRYVANEAHAWVEVWLPREEWIRIDLGGAAVELAVSNVEDKVMYPAGEDPFPKPEEFLGNYTRQVEEMRGLSPEQIADARAPGDEGAARVTEPGGTPGQGQGQGEGEGEGEARSGRGIMTGPGRSRPEIPPEELAGKVPTFIAVARASREGFRGETITVEGAVTDERKRPLEGQRVDIWLAPADRGGDDAVLVGHTATRADGGFRAVVAIPRRIALQDYEVFASTPGDDTYQPSLSD